MGAVITTPIVVVLTLISTKIDICFLYKWIIAYASITYTRWRNKRRFDLYNMKVDNDPYKVNFLPPHEEHELESPLQENHLLKRSDEVFINGINSKSEQFIVRVSRAPNNKAQAWIHLSLQDGRTFDLHETCGLQHSGRDAKEFTCGALRLHYLSPMRRWRIFFNGLLREKKDGKEKRMAHVKFAFIWRASSDVFDFLSDVSVAALARGLANAKWESYFPPLRKLNKVMDIYSQSGSIFGTVETDGTELEEHMYLFGEKTRIRADIHSLESSESFHVLGQTHKNGRIIHIIQASIPNIIQDFKFGFAVQPSGLICKAREVDFNLENTANWDDIKVSAKFRVEGDRYVLKGSSERSLFSDKTEEKQIGTFFIKSLNFTLNGLPGKGIVIKGAPLRQTERKEFKLPEVTHAPAETIPLVVHFHEKICQRSDVTGGKGSSLGKLTELSKEFQNFIVPNGIVVTTAAYALFANKDILKSIETLEKTLYKDTDIDMERTKTACKKVIDTVVKSTFAPEIEKDIAKKFREAFVNKKQELKFSVRSSATGEDTEQMSAAGQMETFLGVSGMEEILVAVKKCWASQFSHIAVQYKRQNGQVINSPMAVVIQQMVPCDVAGVLFTCDPLTGNPMRMSITANYGLGESVVSGSAEPDSIELVRSLDGKLEIKNKIVGLKAHRIIMKDDGGTEVQEIASKEQTSCCLTDNAIFRLGSLALNIEKNYGSHRDIEWGFWNNNVYIFQSRPVTSGVSETDFEIDHEFDAPMRTEYEYFTKANVGEVMPGATSPLGAELFLKVFDVNFQRKTYFLPWKRIANRYFPRGLCSMYHHVIFYALDLFPYSGGGTRSSAKIVSSISIFGRVIDDNSILEMADERNKTKKVNLIASLKERWGKFNRYFFGAQRRLNRCLKQYGTYRIPVEKFKNSQELFDELLRSCTDLTNSALSHMKCSETSSKFSTILFNVLQQQKGGVDSDVYRDFATLVTTSSGTESAEVPAALEQLSIDISKDIKAEDFRKMDLNEAVQWLNSTPSKSGTNYREFLEKHGHRCLKEFDMRSSPWEADQKPLVQTLQTLVGRDNSIGKKETEEKKKNKSTSTLLSELSTPLNWKSRLLVRIFLPLSRSAVHLREDSKNILIKSFAAWRKGYKALAELMVLEGRIPDSDLLFFMTLEELSDLLATRSPKVLSKAVHRRRRFPILDSYIFPELLKGFPEPVNKKRKQVVVNEDNFSMKGIPVSQGIAIGTVRVALTLEEAAELQPGEILVTYCTDIGWSPYFPMLGGVVTELGGLISHGAVVSREYGLPCIAGLHGATQQFQTGDYVQLDGNKGILQKISKTEDI